MVRILASAALALAASAGLAATTDASKCHGINYSNRAGPDWAPAETKCKSPELIKQELATLKKVTDIIRIYSLSDCDQANAVVPAAVEAGLKVELGLWVDKYHNETYPAEKAAFEELLKNKDVVNKETIVGVHVGSEAILRDDLPVQTLIGYMKEIKEICTEELDVPVTITDVAESYYNNKQLYDVVDFVSANIFPFWDRIPIDKAVNQFLGKYQKLTAASKGKEVIIGETGWPWAGHSNRGSPTSPENAAQYFSEFTTMAEKKKIKYFYFASFDEDFKIQQLNDTKTVEAHFGLFHKNGTLKDSIESLKVFSFEDKETPVPSPVPSPTPSVSKEPTSPVPSKGETDKTPAPSKGATDKTPAPSKTDDSDDDSTDVDTPVQKLTPAPSKGGSSPTPAPTKGGSVPTPSPTKGGSAPTPAPSKGTSAPTPAPTKGGSTPTSAPSKDGSVPTPAPTGGKGTPMPAKTDAPTPAPSKPRKDCKA
ncbi:hypothetical protein Poli38472_007443 [Pythium oligandrum]|uniref:glucan endo-1,3-beta-D-glucosidase n=1 Tax=Pythium oligandrum TaxID=41045 RepID=A0A8K1FM22_PYTOL|nr:hypothetical protein Poli38472_007443 [Pythium oligandrum]|eukprot:TMW67771.1 hypothetical protein Poli38472_007443 [Pythium oligandrum]